MDGRSWARRTTRSLRSAMKDFWLSCGHHLLDRDRGGGLVVTDDFLKAYLARREVTPPPEACVAERTLHAALLAEPRRPVDADHIAAIADADARDNWAVMIAWRDLLIAHRTIEAAYLQLVRAGMGKMPPLFVNQLVHVILRNLLDGCDDPFTLRAAELLFRPQRLTTHGSSLIAADDELIAGASPHSSPLVSMLGLPANAAIDVLNDDNAATYWARSDRDRGYAVERRNPRSRHPVAPDRPLSAHGRGTRRRVGGGRRRAYLSVVGNGAGWLVAHEAAEPHHRAAVPPYGGGVVTAASALARIPVGVVVERRRAASPWIDM